MVDTIFAQATPPGRSGIAVIRVSGVNAVAAAERLGAGRLRARRAHFRRLTRPSDGAPLDDAVVVWFDGPHSFTGEDVVELQVHGSRAVCRSVLNALEECGLRVAAPGEFTRRALLNGKLDLAQVEGLGDLLAAESEAQAQQALRSMNGAVSATAAEWRSKLVDALGLIEATIDFSDDELPDGVLDDAVRLLRALESEWRDEVRKAPIGERVRQGFEVVLVGPPNVGKSTLLNALAGREAAITSSVPGTTRDPIEVMMDVRGLPVTFVDLAGIRAATDEVEAIGVERALRRIQMADLRVFLREGDLDETGGVVATQTDDIVVGAKADIVDAGGRLAVSGRTGQGIESLLELVHDRIVDRVAGAGLLSHERQRIVVERGISDLSAALRELSDGRRVEVASDHVRHAVRAVDALVGRVDTEDVLEVIFGRFCIGK